MAMSFLLGSTSTAQPLTVTGTEPTTSTLRAMRWQQLQLHSERPRNGECAACRDRLPAERDARWTCYREYSDTRSAGHQPSRLRNRMRLIWARKASRSAISMATAYSILRLQIIRRQQSPCCWGRPTEVSNLRCKIMSALRPWASSPGTSTATAYSTSQWRIRKVSAFCWGKATVHFSRRLLSPWASGTSPWALAVADFNGDGKADLAVTDASNAGVVRILLGNGDGTFNVEDMQTEVGMDPEGIAVGDFNHDGVPDLAVTNFGSTSGTNGLSVLIGNGDGTFQPKVNYTTGKVPSGIAVGDFRGNGNLDLAVANLNDNTVGVFLNDGKGVFEAQEPYATGSLPYGVVVSDFNGDGNLDLAVSNSDDPPNSTVTVLHRQRCGRHSPRNRTTRWERIPMG